MTNSLSIPAMHQDHLVKALNKSCCHKQAAKLLGIHERTVFRWKRIYGARKNPKTGKWECLVRTLPVLSLLLFLVSCYPPRHYGRWEVGDRMLARYRSPCKIYYEDSALTKPLNTIR